MKGAIVVGVDGSQQSMQALEWAAQDAELHRRPLRIVHTLPRYHYDMPLFPPGYWEAAEADGRRIVSEALQFVGESFPSLRIDTSMPAERGLAALLEEAQQAHALVVGTHGMRRFSRLLLGSTSLQLAGHAQCPVVVVREEPSGARNEILVGVDGSEWSTAALGYAFDQAAARGSRLRAVHSWYVPGGHSTYPALVESDPGRRDVEEQVLAQSLAGWTERHPDVEVVREVVYEHPVQALVAASATAGLVVVGSRGLGGVRGLALGSVSHAVLHHALCSVAIVRPHPHTGE